MKFSKTYKGIIKRKISEGVVSPSSLPELYLKTTADTVNINSEVESYPTKIFNIVRSKGKTEITSNTLAIKLTNITIDSVDYYKHISNIDSQFIEEVLLNYDAALKNGTVYINTDLPYIQIQQKLYIVKDVLTINIWERSDNITVRKLKDRFKITIKNVDELVIDLKSTSIFQPTIYKNNLYYYDCIYNTSAYLYTHSFETYTKKEVHHYSNNYKLKDIPTNNSINVQELTSDLVLITYTTFRSNLFFTLTNTEPSSIVIQMIDNLPELKQVQSISNLSNTILEYRPTDNIKINEVQANPYMDIKRFNGRPEGVVFVWKGYEDIKYSRSKDIPFGTERIKLDLKTVMDRELVAFTTAEGVEIKQKYESTVPITVKPPAIYYTGNTNVYDLRNIIEGL